MPMLLTPSGEHRVEDDQDAIDAVIFDMDGVVTDSALAHFSAWKDVFDEFLQARTQGDGQRFRPFTESDYLTHVDAVPRYDVELKTVDRLASVWDRLAELESRLADRPLAIFLDYDGTLTPIVQDCEKATLSRATRTAHKRLADWDKGRAVRWLLIHTSLGSKDPLAICIGDDLTDEDAFEELSGEGIGIVVRDGSRATPADYSLQDPDDVQGFLVWLSERSETAQ